MMNRLFKWFSEERKKVLGLPRKARAGYIWDYYKLWIIGIVSILVLAVAAGITVHNTLSENWFYACFANTYGDIGSDSAFCRDFAGYAGYDLTEKNLVFNAQLYCKPSSQRYGDTYYENLVTYIDSGTLDVLVMEEKELQAVGASGRLLDLTDPRVAAIYEAYRDRLVYCEPYRAEDYGSDMVPVGIDLSGSALVGEYRAYPDGCVLGISAHAPHLDQVERFLAFLFREGEK